MAFQSRYHKVLLSLEICQGTARGQFSRFIFANGPAIWGGCVTRRSIRARSWYPEYSGPESCHGARRVWRTFCRPGTKFSEVYECLGTRFIGVARLSPVTNLVAGTGAVSRYNVDRSQKTVKVC